MRSKTTLNQYLQENNDKPFLVQTLGYLEGTVTPVAAVTPEFIGQLYLNTTTGIFYRAKGTTSSDWTVEAVALATAIVALTDNSAGVANNTLQALADGTTYANDVAAIRNNFADLAAKVNEILTALATRVTA